MKKLITIGLLLCFLIGCSESPVDKDGRRIAERRGTNEFNVVLYSGRGEWTFQYIMVDGHEYLIMIGFQRSGLTHSPKCPCLMNKLILDVAQPEAIIPPPNISVLVNTNTNNCTTNLLWGGGI